MWRCAFERSVRAGWILLILLAPPAVALSTVHEVTIEGSGGSALFTPLILVIRVGETVFWTNHDWTSTPHIVVGENVDTGILAVGDSSDPVRFDEAGTYLYHCPLHATMRNQQIWVV